MSRPRRPYDSELGPPRFSWHDVRRRADSGYLRLTPIDLRLFRNVRATDGGGSFYGDSGSLKFIPCTHDIVSLSTLADHLCVAESANFRLDIPEARDFLGGFVTLP